jgi:hypothetical protein
MCIGMANGGKTPKEMTPQEVVAIEELKIILPYHKGSSTEKIYKLAINALEKQIPKKPHQEEFELNECCPNCEYIFDGFPNYCEYCGQRIDWSDTE